MSNAVLNAGREVDAHISLASLTGGAYSRLEDLPGPVEDDLPPPAVDAEPTFALAPPSTTPSRQRRVRRRDGEPKYPMPAGWALSPRMREHATRAGMSAEVMTAQFTALRTRLAQGGDWHTAAGWAWALWDSWVRRWSDGFGRARPVAGDGATPTRASSTRWHDALVASERERTAAQWRAQIAEGERQIEAFEAAGDRERAAKWRIDLLALQDRLAALETS